MSRDSNDQLKALQKPENDPDHFNQHVGAERRQKYPGPRRPDLGTPDLDTLSLPALSIILLLFNQAHMFSFFWSMAEIQTANL